MLRPVWHRFINLGSLRSLSTSSRCEGMFYEFDKKSGYKNKGPSNESVKDRVRFGLKELKKEIKNWTDEVKDAMEFDPIMASPIPGEVDVQWFFNSKTNFDDWVVTNDSDHNEGQSISNFTLSPAGKGLFTGNLSTQVPKDGKVKRAGYCNLRSVRPVKSFKRDTFLDWSNYTHLVMRVRGDGRTYMLTLGCAGYFDIAWNDQYHFALFTRGGPHWQISRIPFSKFYLTSKGRIQDQQDPPPLHRITHFGVTAGDKVNGPFRLEIDYVGLEFDPTHTEKHAYEHYKVPAFYAGY